jgi:hypothetical protein
VLDTARFRLSTRNGGLIADPSLSRVLEDLRAVAAVRLAARYGAQPPAGPLDLGAGLVMLGNLRLYLDALEADLLGAATHLGMSWDLIAAIIGLPASDAARTARPPRSALTVRRPFMTRAGTASWTGGRGASSPGQDHRQRRPEYSRFEPSSRRQI